MSETLKVSYLERPPYYFTRDGKATGNLIELARRIFRDAGIDVSFHQMPPKRIMHELERNRDLHCSVGWFKKPEREKFAKFSLPIYRNQPIVLLTSRKQKDLFGSYTTLTEVFSDKS